MKDNVSLSIKEFAIPFINQFINGTEKFNHEFWKREYIPSILAMPTELQNASSGVIIEMLMILESELQHCSSYRDIIKHAFAAQQSSSRFCSGLTNLSKVEGCALGQQTAQQILNDKYDTKKVQTLIGLSMKQLFNNIASSALEKIVYEQRTKQPSTSICDVTLSKQCEKTNVESKIPLKEIRR